jgi:hypothetical protein
VTTSAGSRKSDVTIGVETFLTLAIAILCNHRWTKVAQLLAGAAELSPDAEKRVRTGDRVWR